MKFYKSLAKYYKKWYEDSLKSAIYCREMRNEAKAKEYDKLAKEYRLLIVENWDAIQFFSAENNDFTMDRYLPKKFQGYK